MFFSHTDFRASAVQAYNDLNEEGSFVDVTLVCDEYKQIEAHKFILSASSPSLKRILMKNPHPHPLIFLHGINYEDIELIVKFIYLGEVEIAQEKVQSFLQAANSMQIQGLSGLSHGFTSSTLKHSTKNNACVPDIDISGDIFKNELMIRNEFYYNNPIHNEVFKVQQGRDGFYSCSQCNYKSSSPSGLFDHKQLNHDSQVVAVDATSNMKNQRDTIIDSEPLPGQHEFLCGICEYKSRHKKTVHLHRQSTHK